MRTHSQHCLILVASVMLSLCAVQLGGCSVFSPAPGDSAPDALPSAWQQYADARQALTVASETLLNLDAIGAISPTTVQQVGQTLVIARGHLAQARIALDSGTDISVSHWIGLALAAITDAHAQMGRSDP